MPALLSDQTAPRSTLTLLEMRDRVRGDLGLRDSSLLTDTDITGWLNEAQDIIARETGWYRTSLLTGTTSGTKEYALPLPSTGRCLRIEEIKYDAEQLTAVTLDQLLKLDPRYRQAGNGTPWLYYVRGSSGFGLHYTPNVTDTDNLLVIYVAKPPRVSAANDFFYVPHALEDGLLIYAKKLASEKDAYGEGARRVGIYAAEWREFMKMAKAQVNAVAERVVTVAGEDALYGEPGPWPRVGWQTIVP